MTSHQDKIKSLQDFLESHKSASIATISPTGMPHSTLIFYFCDKNLHFYFVTKKETKKYENLRSNNKVALNISDTDKLSTVQVEGYAEVVKNSEELIGAIGRLKILQFGDRKVENPPLTKLSGDYVFYKVTPSNLKWLDYNSWENTIILELSESDNIFGDKTLG